MANENGYGIGGEKHRKYSVPSERPEASSGIPDKQTDTRGLLGFWKKRSKKPSEVRNPSAQTPVSKDPWTTYDYGKNDDWYYDSFSSSYDLTKAERATQTPSSGDTRRHRRRLTGKGRATIAVGASVALAAAGVGIKALAGGEGESHVAHPTATASRTPGLHPQEQHRPPLNPDVTSLQQDYQNSSAVFQPGGEPYALGLTAAEKAKMNKLLQEITNPKLSTQKLYEYGQEYQQLEAKQLSAATAIARAKEFEQKFGASFLGKEMLSTGQEFNFYVINNKDERQVMIDPKAVDAWIKWGIDHLTTVYQPDGKGDDMARLAKLAAYQQLADTGKLNTTTDVFFNPMPDCFANSDTAIVPAELSKKIDTGNGTTGTETYSNPSCQDLGVNYSGEGTPVIVGLNAIDMIDTRATEKDPSGMQQYVQLTGSSAFIPVFLHEDVGHSSALETGIFPGKGEIDPKNGFSQDHLQLTNPLTNYTIRFLLQNKSGTESLPPVPIRVITMTPAPASS